MKHRKSLSETLQDLFTLGYLHADDYMAALPEDSLLSDDWQLDSMAQVRQENGNALVIAVSSVQRCMKLVFVEMMFSPRDFSPMKLLRRLFPMRQKGQASLAILHLG